MLRVVLFFFPTEIGFSKTKMKYKTENYFHFHLHYISPLQVTQSNSRGCPPERVFDQGPEKVIDDHTFEIPFGRLKFRVLPMGVTSDSKAICSSYMYNFGYALFARKRHHPWPCDCF